MALWADSFQPLPFLLPTAPILFNEEKTMKISNPVLPGFNADPSMNRVGDTYYIANSTFDL